MKGEQLISLEQIGLESVKNKDYATAIECFLQIIEVQRNFEHGNILYSLAQCYANVSNYELADKFYKEAVEHDEDTTFTEGYANYLKRRGNTRDAFEMYKGLIQIRKSLEGRRFRNVTELMEAGKNWRKECGEAIASFKALGKQLGMSEEETEEELEKL